MSLGRAMVQTVSRWPLTAEARDQARSVHVRFTMDKVEQGQVFSEFFDLLLSESFHHASTLMYHLRDKQ
jgi:hypothetical protein